MQYSNYLGELIRNQGVPNFSQTTFQTFMNVVHLEGRINGLKQAQTMTKDHPRKYELEIFRCIKKLTLLTGNLPPDQFVRTVMSRGGV